MHYIMRCDIIKSLEARYGSSHLRTNGFGRPILAFAGTTLCGQASLPHTALYSRDGNKGGSFTPEISLLGPQKNVVGCDVLRYQEGA